MASTTLEADLFERSRISPSVAAGQSVQFLEHHGFFYQGDARIGTLVDELYSNDRARSDDARLDYFKPTLNQDLVSATKQPHAIVHVIYRRSDLAKFSTTTLSKQFASGFLGVQLRGLFITGARSPILQQTLA